MDEDKKEQGSDVNEQVLKALKKQRMMMGIMGAVIVLGVVGVFGYTQGWFGGKDSQTQQEQQAAAKPNIDENAGEWDGTVPEAPKSDPNSESITIPGYPSIYIPAGETEVAVAFSNPEGNPCYFTFKLVLKDTNEVLFESKQVPPGEALQKATLSRALEAGEYPAVLQISTQHVVNQAAMNGADVETVLEVK